MVTHAHVSKKDTTETDVKSADTFQPSSVPYFAWHTVSWLFKSYCTGYLSDRNAHLGGNPMGSNIQVLDKSLHDRVLCVVSTMGSVKTLTLWEFSDLISLQLFPGWSGASRKWELKTQVCSSEWSREQLSLYATLIGMCFEWRCLKLYNLQHLHHLQSSGSQSPSANASAERAILSRLRLSHIWKGSDPSRMEPYCEIKR